jgi:hypothetical protein
MVEGEGLFRAVGGREERWSGRGGGGGRAAGRAVTGGGSGAGGAKRGDNIIFLTDGLVTLT